MSFDIAPKTIVYEKKQSFCVKKTWFLRINNSCYSLLNNCTFPSISEEATNNNAPFFPFS